MVGRRTPAVPRVVREGRLYAAWLLFSTTGMRWGEVAGLTWGDLDLDAGSVRVEWTLGNIDARVTWKPRPKSRAGERDPATIAALKEHRRRQVEERLLMGPDWVTTTRTGAASPGRDSSSPGPTAA